MCQALRELFAEELEEAKQQGLETGIAEGRILGLSEGRSEGLSQGRSEGLSQGLQQGMAQIFTLIDAMYADHREAEIPRLSKEPDFCQELLRHYGLV